MDLPPLLPGLLLRRYKRFLADVALPDGQVVTAHCPNPGRMTSVAWPGVAVHLSRSENPRRKLAFTWELSWAGEGGDVPVLVNTARPNGIVREAISSGSIPELAGYADLRAEVKMGDSRVDLLLSQPADARRPYRCWVEVKSVTLRSSPGVGAFPDAVSARATRHVQELAARVQAGDRAVLLFLVGRGDVDRVQPADTVDPVYGRALRAAVAAGVQVLAHRAEISLQGIRIGARLPVLLA